MVSRQFLAVTRAPQGRTLGLKYTPSLTHVDNFLSAAGRRSGAATNNRSEGRDLASATRPAINNRFNARLIEASPPRRRRRDMHAGRGAGQGRASAVAALRRRCGELMEPGQVQGHRNQYHRLLVCCCCFCGRVRGRRRFSSHKPPEFLSI